VSKTIEIEICALSPLMTASLSISFSALKMDGRPLYEYARKGIPLPRPIESRKVEVSSFELRQWLGHQHTFQWPERALTTDEQKAVEVALSGIAPSTEVRDEPETEDGNNSDGNTAADEPASAFELSMTVSGGTYVRSLVHDLAHELGSAGHVVTLTRARQGRFTLEPVADDPNDMGCVPWSVFERAVKDAGERDEDGWAEWEREVMDKLVIIE
jgi:tRNA pseudouridine55 synthase